MLGIRALGLNRLNLGNPTIAPATRPARPAAPRELTFISAAIRSRLKRQIDINYETNSFLSLKQKKLYFLSTFLSIRVI